MTPVELLLSKLPDTKRSGNTWIARCPAHDDRRPSLSIAESDDGHALVTCHAGCDTRAVVERLGLTMADLMNSSWSTLTGPTKPRKTRQTSKVYATPDDAIAFLERRHGRCSDIWSYQAAEGDAVGYVHRWDQSDGKKTYRPVSRSDKGWTASGMPSPRPLYFLPDLLAANGRTVYVTEGEKAADAVRSIGLIATTSANGCKSASKSDWSPLAGLDVVILPDADDAGEQYGNDVAAILATLTPAPTVKILRLPDLPFGQGGDIVDFIDLRGGDADDIRSEIEALAQSADSTSPSEAPASTRRETPKLIRMSDVDPTDIRWLWPNRIPIGRLTLLSGRPGEGKSFLTAYIAANISRGVDWVDGSACPLGSVIMCSAEDDPADTIAPRLIAHEADRDHIHILQGVLGVDSAGDEVERIFTLNDLATMRQTLEQLPDCKLIVVDPIGSYLGGGTDANQDNKVRSVLAPICQLAAQHDTALLVVAHNRKAVAPSADDMVMGSRAFTGLARSVLHLQLDPDDESRSRRLLLPGKNNLTKPPAGLAFDISPGKIDGLPFVRWHEGEVDITADEVVNRERRHDGDKKRTERDDAIDWLGQTLAGGPKSASEVKELAKEVEGIAPRTLDRAKKALGVEAYRPENPGPWWWRLKETDADRHVPDESTGGALAFCPGDSANGDSGAS